MLNKKALFHNIMKQRSGYISEEDQFFNTPSSFPALMNPVIALSR